MVSTCHGERRVGPDGEQAEVMVVVGVGGAQEHRGAFAVLVDNAEAQGLLVERGAPAGVSHVEDGVVQTAD